jgi:hypothetical protein
MPNPLGSNWGTYERGIVPAIYPAIKKYSFQAGKPDRMFLGRHDDWFYKHHGGLKVWHMMVSDLENLIKSLDPQFLDYSPLKGLLGFKTWKKYYRLGHISQFENKFDVDNQELIITPNILSATDSIIHV